MLQTQPLVWPSPSHSSPRRLRPSGLSLFPICAPPVVRSLRLPSPLLPPSLRGPRSIERSCNGFPVPGLHRPDLHRHGCSPTTLSPVAQPPIDRGNPPGTQRSHSRCPSVFHLACSLSLRLSTPRESSLLRPPSARRPSRHPDPEFPVSCSPSGLGRVCLGVSIELAGGLSISDV
ncbi:hypothetical protein M432DRAFT_21261 [Thermoascus aurantiacus ATCC 26904]